MALALLQTCIRACISPGALRAARGGAGKSVPISLSITLSPWLSPDPSFAGCSSDPGALFVPAREQPDREPTPVFLPRHQTPRGLTGAVPAPRSPFQLLPSPTRNHLPLSSAGLDSPWPPAAPVNRPASLPRLGVGIWRRFPRGADLPRPAGASACARYPLPVPVLGARCPCLVSLLRTRCPCSVPGALPVPDGTRGSGPVRGADPRLRQTGQPSPAAAAALPRCTGALPPGRCSPRGPSAAGGAPRQRRDRLYRCLGCPSPSLGHLQRPRLSSARSALGRAASAPPELTCPGSPLEAEGLGELPGLCLGAFISPGGAAGGAPGRGLAASANGKLLFLANAEIAQITSWRAACVSV